MHISMVVKALENDIEALKEVAHEFETIARGRTNSKGQPLIPKLKWRREMANISLFRERIVQKRREVADCLRLLQPSQKYCATLLFRYKV